MPAALSAAAIAVYGKLQDIAVAGGVQEDVPQPLTLPCIWYEVPDSRDLRGLGTGSLPELEVRVHTFSQVGGRKEAQDLDEQVQTRLKDGSLTIAGFTQCGLVFYDDTVEIPDSEINGAKVHEVVSFFRIYAEA